MEAFRETSLWKTTLEARPADTDADARGRLRASFLDLRSRATTLVARIAADIPDLTTHDIAHLDALWETASLIAGDSYEITPAEAYVLGGAILLHDAAMSLVAYPGGQSDLRKTDEWRDTVALILRRQGNESLSNDMIDDPSPDVVSKTIPTVLRALHAKQAGRLPVENWPGTDASAPPEYLIQDSDFRAYYGTLIGQIAASHWWDIADLKKLPSVCNAGPGIPAPWTVDPQKISCLLRVADAAHVDHRRAPQFLRTILRPSGESEKHWVFQGKLGKPHRESDAVVYTSSQFTVNDTDAWWLCFDTIQMIDSELRNVDAFLEEKGLPRFAADHVKASESPVKLARFILTAGWQPLDTRLRISDVSALVKRFGGKKLYGDDPRVALRELIQNAADAVRARRCVPGIRENSGVISVSLREREDGIWLEVKDNGIGMGTGVLTRTLLDFGTSLWRSNAMQQEHPGLMGRGLNTTGRFGIGFFSVFMLGEHVKVTSRRHDAASADIRTLEFQHGLASRPILREPTSDERSPECETRVSVHLLKAPDDDGGLLAGVSKSSVIDLATLVASLCPSLDVNIEVTDQSGAHTQAIEAGDWTSVHEDRFLARVTGNPADIHATCTKHLQLLQARDGQIFGRACIRPGAMGWSPSRGIVTIGGLRAVALSHISGMLVGGDPETLTRDSTVPLVPLSVLSEWATQQASLLSTVDAKDRAKVQCAQVVLALGGDPGDLPIGLKDEQGTTRAELNQLLTRTDEIRVFEGIEVEYDEEKDYMHSSLFNDGFAPEPEIVFITAVHPRILSVGARQWPMCLPDYTSRPGPRTPLDAFVSLIQEVWGEDFDQNIEECTVGSVDEYYEITRDVTVFSRQGRLAELDLTDLKL